MEEKKYNSVNHSVRKKDAMQLLLGKPVYVDDITSSDALTVKLLRSPYANAIVEDINVAIAKKSSGSCRCLYMEGCSKAEVCDCRTDISGTISL